jgi:hypothetical protein
LQFYQGAIDRGFDRVMFWERDHHHKCNRLARDCPASNAKAPKAQISAGRAAAPKTVRTKDFLRNTKISSGFLEETTTRR